MINILLIDDDPRKTHRIIDAIDNLPDIGVREIDTSPDIINAKKFLAEKKYELLLLDIQIPTRFGEDPVRNGGVKFLDELKINNRINLPTHIIGITAFDDVFSDFQSAFTDRCWTVIKYNEQSDNWVRILQNKLSYIIADKNKTKNPFPNTFDFDIGIISALPLEADSIRRLFSKWEKPNISPDCANFYTTVMESNANKLKIVHAMAPEMGMVAASVTSDKLIIHFKPKYLVISGIVAGVRGKVNIGDILVADPSWDYASGKFVDKDGHHSFKPNPLQIRLNAQVKAHFQEFANNRIVLDKIKAEWPGKKPDSSLAVHVGAVASGASVIADKHVPELISESNRSVIGFDMETYGVYYAASNAPEPQPIPISIKSVSDFADSEKNDNYREYAAYTSAKTLIYFCNTYIE